MQVLHAVWGGDRFYLWAESSTLPMTAPRTRGRKPKKPKSRAHPFSLTGKELRAVIEGFYGEPFHISLETFLLPSTRKGPLASPWLIREDDFPVEQASELAGWEIETLCFDPYEAFNLLLGFLEQPVHDVAFSSSLRYFHHDVAAALTLPLYQSKGSKPSQRIIPLLWRHPRN